MAARRNGLRFASLAAAFGLAGALAGCAGADVQIDAPILEAAGINLVSKPPPEPDLEEKPPLVVPPDTQRLPKPGERQVAAAEEQWPEDPDIIAAKKAKKAEKERERYCREGDWSGEGGIDEFRKTMGREQRCPSQLGKTLSEALGTGDTQQQQASQ
jgi:hypothetical protein